MFSVAAVGFENKIGDGDGEWRTFGATDAHSATLAARVECALDTVPVFATEVDVRDALLEIAGAGLLSADCDHAPGECDGETGLN